MSGDTRDDDAGLRDPGEAETETAPEPQGQAGTSIGPYQLLKRLGEGGMGEVWLAEQRQPVQRRVAVKLIKRGMDTRRVILRFEAERQALAMMDHPAIAKVHDAGETPQGRPYFVMEHVKGVPITSHCDRQKLSNRERLELFVQVCEGVQHAHQKAVMHRDLKPSNVLVSMQDGRAVPKIIDFGMAKAMAQKLTERTLFTETGTLLGTPEYMSPEQAEMTGQDVDTRTDVYSLGVMLYELLTGALPFDPKELRKAGHAGIARKIREEEPSKPSARVETLEPDVSATSAARRRTGIAGLRRQLSGDLDWITMKALEKDRTRRYGSPSELAADILRHLNDQPVTAGAPSVSYRAGKFIRRHRAGVLLTAAAALVLVAFSVTTSMQASRTAAERDRANAEAGLALQVSSFLARLFWESAPADRPVESITALEILERGAERVRDDLPDQPLLQARMMGVIGGVYMELGRYDEAAELFEETARIRRRELPPGHRETAEALIDLGRVRARQGQYGESERLFDEALQILEDSPDEPLLASGLGGLVQLHLDRGLYRRAEPVARRALSIRERHEPEADGTLTARLDLGEICYRLGLLEEAEELAASGLAWARERLGPHHVRVASAANLLGRILQAAGRYEEADAPLRLAIDVQERNLGALHPDLRLSINALAVLNARLGRFREAEPLFRRSVEIAEAVHGPDHANVGGALVNLANVRRDLGLYEEAEQTYIRALAVLERAVGPDAPNVAMACGNLGSLYHRQKRYEEAATQNRRALEIREKALGPEHKDVALALDNLAASYRELGRYEEAERLLLRARKVRLMIFAPDHPDMARSHHNLALVYREQGRQVEAIELFEKAIELREEQLGSDHPKLAWSLTGLAVLHRERGEHDRAEPLFRRALTILERTLGPEHPDLAGLLEDYANLLRRTGREAEADALETRARKIRGS